MPAATVTVCGLGSAPCLRHAVVIDGSLADFCSSLFGVGGSRPSLWRSTGLSSLSAWHAWRTGTGIFRVHPLSAALLPFLPWTLVCSPLLQVGFLILPCLPGHPLLAALLRVRLRGFKRSPFFTGASAFGGSTPGLKVGPQMMPPPGSSAFGGSVPRLSDPRSTRRHSSAVRASA